jgi:hypothetical protein
MVPGVTWLGGGGGIFPEKKGFAARGHTGNLSATRAGSRRSRSPNPNGERRQSKMHGHGWARHNVLIFATVLCRCACHMKLYQSDLHNQVTPDESGFVDLWIKKKGARNDIKVCVPLRQV